MPKRPPTYRPAHMGAPAARKREVDRDRGSARARGYTSTWDKASKTYRREHPLCEYCDAGAFGPCRVTATARVDHLYPQRRYRGVFWRTEWWVASCDACDALKQALEHQGHAALDALARRLGRPTLDPTA
ncbi:MAG TPA: hypothetical protein VL358_04645 [Caulobacteraceae bacterium]|jgi:5-methylcytosine-specific restriction endonuclease McrA|nr:hypothetical protein [Caulobacteraceae bacterium]